MKSALATFTGVSAFVVALIYSQLSRLTLTYELITFTALMCALTITSALTLMVYTVKESK